MEILPIHRQGSYHDQIADEENPSATALRNLLESQQDWRHFVPKNAIACFENDNIHTIQAAEKAMLYRLRTMTEEEFEALPYGSEGLWRKLLHASRKYATLAQIIDATKSKRYTRTRIDRMILCGFLGLSQRDFNSPAPYCRVLGFNDTGRQILNKVKESGYFVNTGEDTRQPYHNMERQATALYGLFSEHPEAPDAEENYRVYYKK